MENFLEIALGHIQGVRQVLPKILRSRLRRSPRSVTFVPRILRSRLHHLPAKNDSNSLSLLFQFAKFCQKFCARAFGARLGLSRPCQEFCARAACTIHVSSSRAKWQDDSLASPVLWRCAACYESTTRHIESGSLILSKQCPHLHLMRAPMACIHQGTRVNILGLPHRNTGTQQTSLSTIFILKHWYKRRH